MTLSFFCNTGTANAVVVRTSGGGVICSILSRDSARHTTNDLVCVVTTRGIAALLKKVCSHLLVALFGQTYQQNYDQPNGNLSH